MFSTHAQNFMLSFQSLNLTPTIDKPTRVHNNSYSWIDNIFINSLEYSICSGNKVSDLTDYFSQFCILNFSTNRDLCDQSKSKRLTRDFSNYSCKTSIGWKTWCTSSGFSFSFFSHLFFFSFSYLILLQLLTSFEKASSKQEILTTE